MSGEQRCWRCGRKLFEAEADAPVPQGIRIKLPCGRCHAQNVVALDKVPASALSYI